MSDTPSAAEEEARQQAEAENLKKVQDAFEYGFTTGTSGESDPYYLEPEEQAPATLGDEALYEEADQAAEAERKRLQEEQERLEAEQAEQQAQQIPDEVTQELSDLKRRLRQTEGGMGTLQEQNQQLAQALAAAQSGGGPRLSEEQIEAVLNDTGFADVESEYPEIAGPFSKALRNLMKLMGGPDDDAGGGDAGGSGGTPDGGAADAGAGAPDGGDGGGTPDADPNAAGGGEGEQPPAGLTEEQVRATIYGAEIAKTHPDYVEVIVSQAFELWAEAVNDKDLETKMGDKDNPGSVVEVLDQYREFTGYVESLGDEAGRYSIAGLVDMHKQHSVESAAAASDGESEAEKAARLAAAMPATTGGNTSGGGTVILPKTEEEAAEEAFKKERGITD